LIVLLAYFAKLGLFVLSTSLVELNPQRTSGAAGF